MIGGVKKMREYENPEIDIQLFDAAVTAELSNINNIVGGLSGENTPANGVVQVNFTDIISYSGGTDN